MKKDLLWWKAHRILLQNVTLKSRKPCMQSAERGHCNANRKYLMLLVWTKKENFTQKHYQDFVLSKVGRFFFFFLKFFSRYLFFRQPKIFPLIRNSWRIVNPKCSLGEFLCQTNPYNWIIIAIIICVYDTHFSTRILSRKARDAYCMSCLNRS